MGLDPPMPAAVAFAAVTMQDASTALNPALTVGTQIEEVLLAHADDLPAGRSARHRAVRERAIEMMRLVGIPGQRNITCSAAACSSA